MEERLKFLASGAKPRKNKDAMAEVIGELKAEGLFYGDKVRVSKGRDEEASEGEVMEAEGVKADKKGKKEKKEKKEKSEKKKDKKRSKEVASDDSDAAVLEASSSKKKRSKA